MRKLQEKLNTASPLVRTILWVALMAAFILMFFLTLKI